MTPRNILTPRTAILAGAGTVGAAALKPVEVDPTARIPASLVQAVREAAHPITGAASDLHPVLDVIGNATYVLIGEASHGTHEFYATRAELTRRLSEQKGFNAVVIEGDWPDAYRVNNFVRGQGDDDSPENALRSFDNYPEWMWPNTDVRDFVAWMREQNASDAGSAVDAGMYGMDLYSLFRSRDAVLRYLRDVDPVEAARAMERSSPFAAVGTDPTSYGAAVAYGRLPSAEGRVKQQFEAVSQVTETVRNSTDPAAADAAFDAQQNARLVQNAESYYRQMYDPMVNTWNVRDEHMADTIDALAEHLRRRDGYARIVVWAHNSHLGDARATESRLRGEWNVGQLVRERHPGEAILIGFSTNDGTVMASNDWGDPGRVKQVRPALPASFERAFHETGIPAFVLPMREETVAKELRRSMLERAIGVIYRPETERQSHYFDAKISQQFDVIIHFDSSTAVEPLSRTPSVSLAA